MNTIGARALAVHEAAHCAAFLLADWVPLACRIDYPRDGFGGLTTCDWTVRDFDARSMKALLLAVLAGPLSEGATVDPTEWPVTLDHWHEYDNDAQQVRFVVDFLILDRVDWLGVLTRAQDLVRQPRYLALCAAIADELERVDVLLQPELQAIARNVLGACP